MADDANKAASTRSTIGILITRIAMFPISFLVSVFVAVDLGSAGYGIYGFLILFIGPVLHILSFGIGGGVTYLVSRKAYREAEVMLTCVLLGVGIGLTGTAVVGGLWSIRWLGVIGNDLTLTQIRPLLIALPFYGLATIAYRLAMGASWFRMMNTIDLTKAVSMPVILFTFVILLGLGVQGAIYAILANGVLLALVTLLLLIRKRRPEWRVRGGFVREGAQYGSRAWIGDISAQAYNRLDHLLFGFLADESLFGIYKIAASLTELLWLPTNALGPVLFNRISAESDEGERVNLTSQAHRVVFGIVLAGALLVAANVWWFIPFFYQGEYDASILPALILIPGTLMLVTQKVLTKYFSGSNRPGVSSAITAVGALLIGGLAYVLIPLYGPEGAALASTVSYTVMAVVSFVVYRRMITPRRSRLFTFSWADVEWLQSRVTDALSVWNNRLKRRKHNA